MRIFIDAGHQKGVDPGAVSPQCVEVEHNLAIREALRKYIDFVEIPANTTLDERIVWINKNATNTDILISIHTNAGGGNGVESWYYGGYDPAKDKADLLTRFINNYVLEPSRASKPDTASRYGRFGIIRLTKPYAFLVECGFVDSPDQNDTIPEKTDGYARGIAEFCASFGIPLKTPLKETPKIDVPIQEAPQATQTIAVTKTVLQYQFNRNLYPGLKSDTDVVALQITLKSLNYYPKDTNCTGNYLEITKRSVANFQVQNKIVSSLTAYGAGYCGPKTREFLNKGENVSKSS
jgi:hypothetical protein